MMSLNEQFVEQFTLTENIYQGFIQLFEDKNCLHVDKSYALTKGFHNVVMHGNILNGFISYFIGECLPIKNVMIHSQEIKYAKPVYCNDTLIFTASITDIIESVNVIVFKFNFKNSDEVVVAKGKIQIGVLN
jgi:3-hydroxybutyryl-CoA dehydratase